MRQEPVVIPCQGNGFNSGPLTRSASTRAPRMGKGKRLMSVKIIKSMVDLLLVNVNVNLKLQCRDQTNSVKGGMSEAIEKQEPLR